MREWEGEEGGEEKGRKEEKKTIRKEDKEEKKREEKKVRRGRTAIAIGIKCMRAGVGLLPTST